jgi:hypothetical protein
MTIRYFGPDPRQMTLARALRVVEETAAAVPLSLVGEDGTPLGTRLRDAIRTLARELALGPTAALRECPRCGTVIVPSATRCGHCWAPITAPPKH